MVIFHSYTVIPLEHADFPRVYVMFMYCLPELFCIDRTLVVQRADVLHFFLWRPEQFQDSEDRWGPLQIASSVA